MGNVFNVPRTFHAMTKRRLSSTPSLPSMSTMDLFGSQSMDYGQNTAVAPTGTARTTKRTVIGVRGRKGKKLTRKQRNEVKTIIARASELKYFHATIAAGNITNAAQITGTQWDVPQSAGASTDTSRIGDSINWAGTMEVNFTLTIAAADTQTYVRLAIVQWHDTSYVTPAPAVTSIWLNGPSGAPDVWSSFNHDYRHQYTILFDNVYTLIGNGVGAGTPLTTATNSGMHRLRLNLNKLARKNVQYVAGSGQGANRFFMLLCSSTVNNTLISADFKTFFRDS